MFIPRALTIALKCLITNIFLVCWLLLLLLQFSLLVFYDRKAVSWQIVMAEFGNVRKCQRHVSEYFVGLLRDKNKPLYYDVLRSYVSSAPAHVRNYVKKYLKGESLLKFFRQRGNYFTVDLNGQVSLNLHEAAPTKESKFAHGQGEKTVQSSKQDTEHKAEKKVKNKVVKPSVPREQGVEIHVCPNCQKVVQVIEGVNHGGPCSKCVGRQQFYSFMQADSTSTSSSSSSMNEAELEEEVINYFIVQVKEFSPNFRFRDIVYNDLPRNVVVFLQMKYTKDKIHRFFLDHCNIFQISNDEYVFLVSQTHSVGSVAEEEGKEDTNLNDRENQVEASKPTVKNVTHAPKKKKKVPVKEQVPTPINKSEISMIKFFVGVLENRQNSPLTLERLKGHLSQAKVEIRNFIKINYGDKFKKVFTEHQTIFKICSNEISLTKAYSKQLAVLEGFVEIAEQKINSKNADAVGSTEKVTEYCEDFNLRPQSGITVSEHLSCPPNQEIKKVDNSNVNEGSGNFHENIPKNKFAAENTENVNSYNNDSTVINSKPLNSGFIHDESATTEPGDDFNSRSDVIQEVHGETTHTLEGSRKLTSEISDIPSENVDNNSNFGADVEKYSSCDSSETDIEKFYSGHSECYLSSEAYFSSPTSMMDGIPCKEIIPISKGFSGHSYSSDAIDESCYNIKSQPCIACNFRRSPSSDPSKAESPPNKASVRPKYGSKCDKSVNSIKEKYIDLSDSSFKLAKETKLRIGNFLWTLDLYCLQHILEDKYLEEASVQYFCTQMTPSLISFSSLKGKLGQAPPEVIEYMNRNYPGQKFENFFLEHNEFKVRLDYVSATKNQNVLKTAVQNPNELYYSKPFVDFYSNVLKSVVNFILMLQTKIRIKLTYICSVMEKELKAVVNLFSGRSLIEKLKEYFTLFHAFFVIHEDVIELSPICNVFLRFSVESVLLGRLKVLLKDEETKTNGNFPESIVEKCMLTSVDCLPFELNRIAMMNNIPSKVMQKCSHQLEIILNSHANVLLNTFESQNELQFLSDLKLKALSRLEMILISKKDGISYSSIPEHILPDCADLLEMCHPSVLLPALQSEPFAFRCGKIYLQSDNIKSELKNDTGDHHSGSTVIGEEESLVGVDLNKFEPCSDGEHMGVELINSKEENIVDTNIESTMSDDLPDKVKSNDDRQDTSEVTFCDGSGVEFNIPNELSTPALNVSSCTEGVKSCEEAKENNSSAVCNLSGVTTCSHDESLGVEPISSKENVDDAIVEKVMSEVDILACGDVADEVKSHDDGHKSEVTFSDGSDVEGNRLSRPSTPTMNVSSCTGMESCEEAKEKSNSSGVTICNPSVQVLSHDQSALSVSICSGKPSQTDSVALLQNSVYLSSPTEVRSNDFEGAAAVRSKELIKSVNSGLVSSEPVQIHKIFTTIYDRHVENDNNDVFQSLMSSYSRFVCKNIEFDEDSNKPDVHTVITENTTLMQNSSAPNPDVQVDETKSVMYGSSQRTNMEEQSQTEEKYSTLIQERCCIKDSESDNVQKVNGLRTSFANTKDVFSKHSESEFAIILPKEQITFNVNEGQYPQKQSDEKVVFNESDAQGLLKTFREPNSDTLDATSDNIPVLKNREFHSKGSAKVTKNIFVSERKADGSRQRNKLAGKSGNISYMEHSSLLSNENIKRHLPIQGEIVDEFQEDVCEKIESQDNTSCEPSLTQFPDKLNHATEHDEVNTVTPKTSKAIPLKTSCSEHHASTSERGLTSGNNILSNNRVEPAGKIGSLSSRYSLLHSLLAKKPSKMTDVSNSKPQNSSMDGLTNTSKPSVNESSSKEIEISSEVPQGQTKSCESTGPCSIKRSARVILLSKEICIAEVRCGKFTKLVHCSMNCFHCSTHNSCKAFEVLSLGDLVRCRMFSADLSESIWVAYHFTNVSPHRCHSAFVSSVPRQVPTDMPITHPDSNDKRDSGIQAVAELVHKETQTVSSGPILHAKYLPEF